MLLPIMIRMLISLHTLFTDFAIIECLRKARFMNEGSDKVMPIFRKLLPWNFETCLGALFSSSVSKVLNHLLDKKPRLSKRSYLKNLVSGKFRFMGSFQNLRDFATSSCEA